MPDARAIKPGLLEEKLVLSYDRSVHTILARDPQLVTEMDGFGLCPSFHENDTKT